MDRAAAAFGIEPSEIRRRNLIDNFPYVSATGLTFDEASYRQTMEMAVAALDLPAFRARQKKARAHGQYLGIGFSRSQSAPAMARRPSPRAAWRSFRAWRPSTSAWIPPASSRRVSAPARTARACAPRSRRSSPMRSASRRRIRIIHGDTDRTPYGFGTFASRSAVIAGGASLLAARKVRAKLIKIASHAARSGARRYRA